MLVCWFVDLCFNLMVWFGAVRFGVLFGYGFFVLCFVFGFCLMRFVDWFYSFRLFWVCVCVNLFVCCGI